MNLLKNVQTIVRRFLEEHSGLCDSPMMPVLTGLKISFWLGNLQLCRAAGAGLRHHAGRDLEAFVRREG
jgi:hypothetical protein